jgi:hypothetical protein
MQSTPPTSDKRIKLTGWFFVVLVLGLVGIFYRLLHHYSLYDSAALYMGLPFLLALGLSLTAKQKSAMGTTMKGITIALLLSAVVFQEGYICIIFSAPIFYTVGAIIAGLIDWSRRRKNKNTSLKASAAATFIALLSLEGTSDFTTILRNNVVTESKILSANITDVKKQLAKSPVFSNQKPLLLRIFPYPTAISGQGLQIGAERIITFTAYKHIWWHKIEGELVLRVSENSQNHIVFSTARDSSYLSHYLKWQSSEIFLEPIDAQHTKVTWKLAYKRILDPIWYFGPMQRYAVKLAAKELIDHVATPTA